MRNAAKVGQLQPQTTYPAVVGRILVHARKRATLDQGALASRVGVSQSTWSRIERGDSALSVEQLIRAASALGTSPSCLLAEADQAAAALRAQGVIVNDQRVASGAATGLALIGAVALGFLVVKALSSK